MTPEMMSFNPALKIRMPKITTNFQRGTTAILRNQIWGIL